MKRLSLLVPLLLLANCAVVPRATPPQVQYWQRLWALCGRAYEGHVVTTDQGDREFASARLVIHVATCTPDAVRIAFHVGVDASRTWLIGRTTDGLRLTHLHRSREGVEEPRSHYGGDTVSPGSPRRQEFPANEATRALFAREDIAAASDNVWSIEISPGRLLAYAVDRPGRHLRIDFDLTRPVRSPGPAWGER